MVKTLPLWHLLKVKYGESWHRRVITGLKDLEANADGSSAANKNYVDNQLRSALEEVAGNRPFDYYLNDIKVSKDKDGNFYKEESGKKVKLTDAEKAQVVIKVEPQSTPMTVSNIKAAKLRWTQQTQ